MAISAEPLVPLFQSEGLLVLDKPAGLLVHPTQLDAHAGDSLLERAQAQWGQRLHPVHRLDKGTSGLLLMARDATTASLLGEAFREGRVSKRYWALVRGWPAADSGRVDHALARDPELPSQGQAQLPAQTDWRCLRRLEWHFASQPGFSSTRGALLELAPQQGRRHQIRRHCKHMAHPLLGDATHGKGPLNRAFAAHVGLQRLWLHALWLRLPEGLGAELSGLTLEAAPGPEWAPFRVQPSSAAA